MREPALEAITIVRQSNEELLNCGGDLSMEENKHGMNMLMPTAQTK